MRFSFDRDWRFSVGDFGILPKTAEHDEVYGFAKAGGIAGAAALEYDDTVWDTVDLPHDWQHNQEFDRSAPADHGYRKGLKGCYRKKFCLEESDRARSLSIVFDGIAGVSDIYLNGCKLYHNESHYNSFSVEITDIANYGIQPNILTVEVDCSVWEGWWYEGSGIYRHVWLLKEPLVHPIYNGIVVRPEKKEQGWGTQIEIELENASMEEQQYNCAVEICDDGGNVLHDMRCGTDGNLKPYGRCSLSWELPIDEPVLWEPDHPYLYQCKIRIENGGVMDEAVISYGYRTIKVDPDKGFFLNDRPVKLLGTCNHQDHAGIGAALPDEVQRYRLELLKDMGCNAYRCAHHNPTPELLDMCDRMGIMVMDENRALNTSEERMRMLREMVQRDRNHPSVIMYSIFNEEPLQGTAKGRKLAARMVSAVKAIDTQRPVLGAFNGGFMEPDGAATVFDITGINYYIDSYDAFHEKFPQQPIVAAEIVSAFATRDNCTDSVKEQIFSNYDESAALWGETVREASEAVLTRDFIMGMFVWTGFDYRGEPTPYEWPSVSSHFGTLDTCGFPKDTYYLYQAYWKNEPILHIVPHWNHKAGAKVRVMTYSNCEEVELFLNGRSVGKKENKMYEQCSWELEFEPGSLRAAGYMSGRQVTEAEQTTAGEAVSMNVEANRNVVHYSTKDALILNISAVDVTGTFQPLEEGSIDIITEGAKLLGVGNGDPNSHARDDDKKVRFFRGRCQIILQAMDCEYLTVKLNSDNVGMYTGSWDIQKDDSVNDVLSTAAKFVRGWRMSHIAVPDKPKLKLAMEKSDMNSLEPVEFEGKGQTQLDGKAGWHCLYRTTEIEARDAGKTLCFKKVAGDIEVFLDEELLVHNTCEEPGELTVEIPPFIGDDCVLSVIIKNSAADLKAGIFEPVMLIP